MKYRVFIVQLAVVLALSACVGYGQSPKPSAHKLKAQANETKASPTQAPALAQSAAAPAPAAPTPIQTAPPPTPEQGPSSPPQVSFQAGQLTIEARNSTMGDVLNAVKQKTGAAVDMPATSNERVVGQFGPGAPRDVLSQLLNGSHYDYVLLGSPADPGALKKIVLMARAAGPEPAPSQQQNRPNQNLQTVPEVDNDQNTTEETPPEEPQEVQPPPEEESQQPDQNLQQAEPGQNGPVVKTPEQLLQELQQQQQQQQQQRPPQ